MFLENKVETLAIHRLIKLAYNYRYFEKGNYSKYSSRERLTTYLRLEPKKSHPSSNPSLYKIRIFIYG